MKNPPGGGFIMLELDRRLRGDDARTQALDPVSPRIHVLHGMKSSVLKAGSRVQRFALPRDDVLAKAVDPVSAHIHVLHGMKSS